MNRLTRRGYLAAAGAAALAGCASTGQGGGNYDPGGTDADSTGSVANGDGSGCIEPRTGVDNQDTTVPTADDPLPLPLEPSALRSEARSGGPPKDGIPSIDDPQFAGADGIDFLDDGDPVFGVARDGVAKAYPQNILVHHEIVNDTLAGEPIAATYCPLTGTAMGFERGETTFGVSGRLINNNLVMYDRATEAWWPQVLASAIPGPWNDDPPAVSLREFRLIWTTWGQWRTQYPETRVLTTNTGHARNYAQDPYGAYNPKNGYYVRENTMFPELNPDDRHHPKTVFLGARTPGGAVAFRKETLAEQQLIEGTLCETPVLAVHDPRLSTGYVYRNPEERAFEHEGDTVTDDSGTEYEPDSLPLSEIYAFDAMWFAWSGFYPWTAVYA
jgi:hypothetical protein